MTAEHDSTNDRKISWDIIGAIETEAELTRHLNETMNALQIEHETRVYELKENFGRRYLQLRYEAAGGPAPTPDTVEVGVLQALQNHYELYAVWWTDQHDSDSVHDLYGWELSPLPEYIRKQFNYRYGRAGGGRMWVPEDIPVTGLRSWSDDKEYSAYAEHAGGIVFRREDLSEVSKMPGRVTDLDLNTLPPPE